MFLGFFKYINILKNYLGNRIYLIFLLSIISGVTDSFGIALIIPVFQTLDSNNNLLEGRGLVENFIRNFFNFINVEITPLSILTTLITIFLFKGVLTFLITSITAYYNGILFKKLQIEFCKDTSNISYSHFLEKDSGYFSNMVNEQTKNVIYSLKSICNFIKSFVDSLIYTSFALVVSNRLSIILIIFVFAIFITFQNLNQKVKKVSRSSVEQSSQLSKIWIEFLDSFKYLKATAQLKQLFIPLSHKIKKLSRLETKKGIYEGFTKSFKETAGVTFIISIVGIQYFFFKEPITQILVSLALLYKASNSVFSSQYYWQIFLTWIGSLEVINSAHNTHTLNKEITGSSLINGFKSLIVLKNVNFSYKNSKNILKNINLEIPLNSSLAIVGKSGSGKSSIINLLLGLFKPTKGAIFIDDLNLSKIDLESWRSNIGYVSQETNIFNQTIAANITLNFVKKEFDKSELKSVKDAAKLANIDDFIESLPKGYNTIVGEKGLKLSGGQRQRIFIARELYKKPKILIMDEATSALDYKSEEFIKKSIDKLKGEITLVIVAHRLSTIKNVDNIYVLKDGNIIENGNYSELKRNKNSFFNYLNEYE